MIDDQGRLYVATVWKSEVQVFDKAGRYLGVIPVPRRFSRFHGRLGGPTNVAFSGPDKRTLYITALEGLYRLETLTQGADRVGK